jgi:hypothetical protein
MRYYEECLFVFNSPGGQPLCYRAMRAVFGVSMFLLSSIVGTPKARGTALPNRQPRLGDFKIFLELTYSIYLPMQHVINFT